MYLFNRLLLFVLFLTFAVIGKAQVQIPGFTGYAIPVEKSNEEDESSLFNEKTGVQHWEATQQQLQYFFEVRNSGNLSVAIWTRNEKAGSRLKIALAGKSFIVPIPASKSFVKVPVGNFQNVHHGFYAIHISAIKKTGKTIADIQSIELAGAATMEMHFNSKARRNAASVHLLYPLSDTANPVIFYNELSIPRDADPVHSYFMACGFARGYFGMQVNSDKERRVIFSVWDAGKEAVDRNKVEEDNKVRLIAKGNEVIAEGFGNEGTGGHSHWVYPWKTEEVYKFLVTALPDSATNSTIYTGYFFIPEKQQWKLIASFKAPKDGKYLGGLYSFVENFWGVNGQLSRKAFFGNQWIRNENGNWQELTAAKFSYDATGKAGDRIDYGGGSENGKFYLWNGGFQTADAKAGDIFLRKPQGKHPEIDLYRNADSLEQAVTEQQLIFSNIGAGKMDTTGSIDGIFYKIIAEGNGKQVLLTDTITAFYKGALLNGTVFDETKDQPASFPLNRLIKGWQLALPLIKEGGKIRLILPSAKAYGIRSRSPKIPPNSVLVFDIEVKSVKR